MIRSPYKVKIPTFNERSFSCLSVTIKNELQHTALPCWFEPAAGDGQNSCSFKFASYSVPYRAKHKQPTHKDRPTKYISISPSY